MTNAIPHQEPLLEQVLLVQRASLYRHGVDDETVAILIGDMALALQRQSKIGWDLR